MAEIVFRSAVAGDAQWIALVHRLSRADYYGEPPADDDDRESMWSGLLRQLDRDTYLAERHGSVVGFMSARLMRGSRSELELTALYVLPAMHGRGIGSRLYTLFDLVLSRSASTSGLLEVWSGNGRAIEFYLRRGWNATEESRPGPDGLDFVTYRLPMLER